MNPDNCGLASGLVSLSYIRQGEQALARRQRLVKALLSSRRLPERGWDEATIEMFIRDCSAMDSNNFLDNVGVGEREGRVACPLVARRHYGLAHGIGRSGDVAAEQPKAAGSSLMAAVTAHLTADALRIAGLTGVGPVSVLPLATGMALTLVLLALRPQRPPGADVVVWSRVDQKTCLKAVTAAGLRPHVVELRRRGDELVTDMEALSGALAALGADRIAAVVTTSSCFAPRAPDDLVAVARLCAAAGVPHVINNAYGIQSRDTCRQVAAAWAKGRVDAVVQSTDKNFMVPVGGALVAAPAVRPGLVGAVNGTYPGRASVAAHLDLLMTLLHWGAEGWRQVLMQREELVPYLRARLQEVAVRQGERLLDTPSNPISMALTLDSLVEVAAAAAGAAAGAQPASAAAAAVGAPSNATAVSGSSAAAAMAEVAAADDVPARVRTSGAEGAAAAAAAGGSSAEAADGAGTQAADATEAAAADGAGGAACDGDAEAEEPGLLAGGAALDGDQEASEAAAAGGPPAGKARARARAAQDVTFFGAMLWSRCVSGTRVVAPGKTQTVGGVPFRNYGSHTDVPYPSTYMTAAAALGTTHADVDELVVRLERCFAEFRKKCGAGSAAPVGGGASRGGVVVLGKGSGEDGGAGMGVEDEGKDKNS